MDSVHLVNLGFPREERLQAKDFEHYAAYAPDVHLSEFLEYV